MHTNRKRFFGIGVVFLLVLAIGGGWRLWQQVQIVRWVPPADWLTPLPTYPAYLSPTPTPSHEAPTLTPAPTLSPTLTPSPTPSQSLRPTSTPTPPVVTLIANGNMYCRQGPAPYYEKVAVLRPGDRVRALGFSTFEEDRYWLVALPDTRLCWVRENERYMAFEGADALTALPAFPTPEPPAMAFTVTFAGQAECGSKHGWLFNIVNYGTQPIESVKITFAQGLTSGVWNTYLDWWRDCATRSGVPAIQPAHSALLTVEGVGPGYGQTFTATVRACARDYLLDPCAEQTFSFRP